jgi:hypothetical protein
MYEIIYVYYDVPSKKVAAYRRCCDNLRDTGDRFPYEVDGPTGLEALTNLWENQAGINNAVRWPTSDIEFRAAQLEDEALCEMIDRADHGADIKVNKRTAYTVLLPDGTRSALRCRLTVEKETPASTFASQDILVLPSTLVPLCLRYYHDGCGHPGRNRAVETIAQRYWWPGRYDAITDHIFSCRECKLRKADNRTVPIPTQRYPRAHRPFDLVHIDLTGPLPKSGPLGYEYILVVKRALTHWVELVPLTSKDSQEIAHALFNHVYCRHGAVSTYVSDKGSEFINGIIRAVNHLLHQHHTSTTPYHPQANGKVENFNRTLKDMLYHYCNECHSDWSVYLQVVAHAYRTTINEATGYSPFRALYGREARQPSETWITDFAKRMNVDIDQYAQELALALHFSWSEIADRVTARNEKLDRKFARADMQGRHGENKPAKSERMFQEYSVGDQFYLRSYPARFFIDDANIKHKISSKLQRRYSGPHTIVSRKNPVTYRASVNGKIRTVNAYSMKRDQPAPKVLRDVPDFHEDNIPLCDQREHKENENEDPQLALFEEQENDLAEDPDIPENPLNDYPDDSSDEEDENEHDNAEYNAKWTTWMEQQSASNKRRAYVEPMAP